MGGRLKEQTWGALAPGVEGCVGWGDQFASPGVSAAHRGSGGHAILVSIPALAWGPKGSGHHA